MALEVIDDFLAFAAEESHDHEAEGRPPERIIERYAELRLGALRLPESLGGYGVSVEDYFSFIIDFAAIDVSAAHIPRLHTRYAEHVAVGTRTTDEEHLAALIAKGDLFTGVGGSGSVSFTGSLEAGDLRVSGQAKYRTGARYSQWVHVRGELSDGSTFGALVPADRDGVHFDDDWVAFGQRRTSTGRVALENVELRAEDRFEGLVPNRRLDHYVTFHQLYLNALIAGIAANAASDVAQYVARRNHGFVHANSPEPRRDPQIQEVVGRVASAAGAARWIVLGAARDLQVAVDLIAAGSPQASEALTAAIVSIAKSKVTVESLGLDAVTHLFEAGGASSVQEHLQLDRHWRNIRTISVHNPTIYKARFVGDNLINGASQPEDGAF